MAHMKNVVTVDPCSIVIWVDKCNAFKTHLAPIIDALREKVTLNIFTDTDSALKGMHTVVNSSQNEIEGTRRQRIACVITNMQRRYPLSGLILLQKMKNVFRANVLNNEFSSFPPTVVYSESTVNNASLIDECKAAGGMIVLSNNANEVQRIIIESVYASICLNFLLNPLLEQKTMLSNIEPKYHALFYMHYLNPLPDKYGGKLTAVHAQQLVLLEWRLLYDVLLSDTLKAFASHCASDKHYIGGGLAINHWLKSSGFPSLLTCDCDFRFESKANIELYANQMKSILEKHTLTVRVNMSRLGLKCGDVEVAMDSNGYRVYFPLRYYDLSSSSVAAAAAGLSYYDFMWKVFDVSHNWKRDPIDIVQEGRLCYIGEKEIFKELEINYGNHKEKRRELRLELINFVRKSK